MSDEAVQTVQACGRVLAMSVHSALELPPFDKSAVDGYAIAGPADQGDYQVIGTVVAGQAPAMAPLGPGQAMRVMTGAPVPSGTVEVVMQEDTTLEGSTVTVHRHRERNVCSRDEDMRVSDLVLPAGHRLRPLDIANLLACGVTDVRARRLPRVALITTGNELCDDPARLRPGQIIDSNGPLLVQLSSMHGLDVVFKTHVADDLDQTRDALEQALEAADLVIMSGGVSVGDLDVVPNACSALGLAIVVHGLSVKPGRPVLIALSGHRPVFGLPGNPVAAYLMFHLLVLRAVAHLTASPVPIRVFSLPLASALARKKAERMEFFPSRLNENGQVTLLEYHGSAHLHALVRADGFAAVPQDVREVAAGQRVAFWSFGSLDP